MHKLLLVYSVKFRKIDDNISVLMFLVFVLFYGTLCFILVLCLVLEILSKRFLGRNMG